MKCVTQISKNETKEQRSAFLGESLGTLNASLLRNMLDKGVVRAGN